MMRGDGWVYERRYKNGSRWWIAYSRDGKEYRESAGATKEEAEKKLAKVRRKLDSRDFIESRERRVTVNELLDDVRQGFLEPAEFEKFAACLPEPINDIARFACHSGWRRGEILPLRWDAVDRRTRVARLCDSKNGEPRTVPLIGELWEVIERRWEARQYTT
jgi:integrase